MKFDKKTQLSIAYAILTLFLLLTLQTFFSKSQEDVKYSEFRAWVKEGLVQNCTLVGEHIVGQVDAGGQQRSFRTVAMDDPELIHLLEEQGIPYDREPANNWFSQLVAWVLPALIFVGIWMFLARRMGGGSGGLMSIGKSKAKVYMEKGTLFVEKIRC